MNQEAWDSFITKGYTAYIQRKKDLSTVLQFSKEGVGAKVFQKGLLAVQHQSKQLFIQCLVDSDFEINLVTKICLFMLQNE